MNIKDLKGWSDRKGKWQRQGSSCDLAECSLQDWTICSSNPSLKLSPHNHQLHFDLNVCHFISDVLKSSPALDPRNYSLPPSVKKREWDWLKTPALSVHYSQSIGWSPLPQLNYVKVQCDSQSGKKIKMTCLNRRNIHPLDLIGIYFHRKSACSDSLLEHKSILHLFVSLEWLKWISLHSENKTQKRINTMIIP